MLFPEDQRELRTVDVDDNDRQRIDDFLQGAVYCWCKNKKDEWFSLQKLMGGENFDWQGTPLYALYSKHIGAGLTNEQAIDQAGKEGGWLLKSLLNRDKRSFETRIDARSRIYLWSKITEGIRGERISEHNVSLEPVYCSTTGARCF